MGDEDGVIPSIIFKVSIDSNQNKQVIWAANSAKLLPLSLMLRGI
jgi:hypothetical protein